MFNMTDILPINQGENLLAVAGAVANGHAARGVFDDFNSRKSENTRKTYKRALEIFATYLQDAGLPHINAECLQNDPKCWQGVTWGIVQAFVQWMLDKGFSVATVNNRLAVVKKYARLATKAGAVTPQDEALIRMVTGYGGKEARRIDKKRDITRVGRKKAAHVSLSPKQALTLKGHDLDTPQGRRDALLMCLMLDMGLRCGEVAALTVEDFNLKAGELRFFRRKVGKWQTHKLTADTLRAAIAYFEHDAPKDGRAILGSRKGAQGLTERPMSERAITKRVRYFGQKRLDTGNLSAHDLRHYWATDAARNGTNLFALQEAGGWASLNMPRRYVEDAQIANEGVILSVG